MEKKEENEKWTNVMWNLRNVILFSGGEPIILQGKSSHIPNSLALNFYEDIFSS